ncbi:hypothetical protein F4781DRAFT_200742 [Annulohypoxylon bovei var. microspora]|nr:hypothetical protein F4781DRAFT_200742 [Annulohypoxylon bovei var. microspora]
MYVSNEHAVGNEERPTWRGDWEMLRRREVFYGVWPSLVPGGGERRIPTRSNTRQRDSVVCWFGLVESFFRLGPFFLFLSLGNGITVNICVLGRYYDCFLFSVVGFGFARLHVIYYIAYCLTASRDRQTR